MKTIQRVLCYVGFTTSILILYCCMFLIMNPANRLVLIIAAGVIAVISRVMYKELDE
jgi:inner membrane protein involved in colicin E2 resistance